MVTLYRVATDAGLTAAEALAEGLEALGALATDLSDHDDGSGLWEASGLFDRTPDAAALAVLAAAQGAPAFRATRVAPQDWVRAVQAALSPVSAGPFVVHGSHDRHRVPVNRIGLLIEAAEAFGTGHHPTTEGCLLALAALDRAGIRPARIADVGGGTGVLAIAALRLWRRARAVAGDIDPVATGTAAANARANGVGMRLRAVTASGLAHPALRGRFDLILANILAAPLKRLAGAVAAARAPGAPVVLSGLLTRQVPAVLASYRGHGLEPVRRFRRGEWTTLILR